MTIITLPVHKGKPTRVGTKRKPDCMFPIEAEIIGHFAIHRTVLRDSGADFWRPSEETFSVTHVPTKGHLGSFYFEKNARAFIEEIKGLTDWSIEDGNHYYKTIKTQMSEVIKRTQTADDDEFWVTMDGDDEPGEW